MNRRALAFAAIIAGVASSTAATAAPESCAEAAFTIEQQLGLPSGLLRSIGEVESGNQPWSVDRDGKGARFASAQDAIDFVRDAAGSSRYTDVGCFQVDLAFHPDAFRTLADAFNPLTNAAAAGRFLLALRRDASSWTQAVARYHSDQPDRGGAYAARVYASLGAGALDRTGFVDEIEWGIRIIVPAAYRGSAAPDRPSARRGLPVVQTP